MHIKVNNAECYLSVTIHTYTHTHTVGSDNDRYADERVDEDAKKQKRGNGTRSLFFVRENHDRGGYIRCIEQQGLTAFN